MALDVKSPQLGVQQPATFQLQPAQANQQVVKASLIEFERAIARRDYQTAVAHTLAMLDAMDRTMGGIENIDTGTAPQGVSQVDLYRRFATRFIAGFSDILISGRHALQPMIVEVLFAQHRWIDNLFAISGFQSGDHLSIHLGGGAVGQWRLSAENLGIFFLLFTPTSSMDVAFDECLAVNRPMTIVALIAYLSARIVVTERGTQFREKMLKWLPDHFTDVNLGTVLLQRLTEPYCHCSYAFDIDKHKLKANLIQQMRRSMLEAGCQEYQPPAKPRPKGKGKPRIVIITEHFAVGHAIYRTHSRAVRALKERFEVIGVLHGDPKDPDVLSCFDDVIRFPMADLNTITKTVSDAILAREPDIVFHLGIGLTVTAIALASLRLAPIQCVSYGHTATTMSPAIDYMVLPEDFVLSKTCYSEELLLLPSNAFPYEPRVVDRAVVDPVPLPRNDEVMKIAVPASVMKINAFLLGALRRIAQEAGRPVEFHFFPLGSRGVAYVYLDQEIKRQLPQAVVHAEAPHDIYARRLADCAFFVCPFPYGNMNSIADAVSLGLPGVCLDGAEAHSHADVAIFKRMGLPDELAASTVDEYVAAAVRLVNDKAWLTKCRKIAAACDIQARFYDGDARLFSEAVYGLLAK